MHGRMDAPGAPACMAYTHGTVVQYGSGAGLPAYEDHSRR